MRESKLGELPEDAMPDTVEQEVQILFSCGPIKRAPFSVTSSSGRGQFHYHPENIPASGRSVRRNCRFMIHKHKSVCRINAMEFSNNQCPGSQRAWSVGINKRRCTNAIATSVSRNAFERLAINIKTHHQPLRPLWSGTSAIYN